MGKTYWMLVTTAENFGITRARGFKTQGIEASQRKKAVRFSRNDRLLYYLSDLRAFAATATATSGHFEEHTRVWKHPDEREDFPNRVNVRPDVVLNEDQFVDALQVGPRLDYVRRWPPEDWHLAFFGPLHILPQRDFSYLEEEMKRAGARRKRRRRSRRGRGRGASRHGARSRPDVLPPDNGGRADGASESPGRSGDGVNEVPPAVERMAERAANEQEATVHGG